MKMRIGKVTNIYPSTGKVKVLYEDEKSASLPLSMLTMNQEYSMPKVGDRVVTMHMESGSSKGFVLGTYYGGSMLPKANEGYRKDYGNGAYMICNSGEYLLSAESISISGRDLIFKCAYEEESLENLLKRIERIEDQLGLPHTV